MNTLGDLASRRNNNFNLIRMLAATAVLVSHSYPLSQGSTAVEPLSGWLGLSLGELAVITFFCVSGFFISLSRDRAPGLIDFVAARCLRIYPGLTLVLLLSVFLIGPIFTTLSTPEYLRSGATYGYLSHNLTLFSMQFQLPGLFEDNPWPGINGSLWTLFYEVMLYVLVGGLGIFSCYGNNRRFATFLLVYGVAYVTFKVLSANTTLLADLHRLQYFFTWGFPFVLGMSLYRYRQHIQHRFLWFLPMAALAAGSYQTPYFFECFVLAWTYLIFYLGFATHPLVDRYNRLGDYSYGVYIYAFPVQEILAHQFKGIGPVTMMLVAFPIVLAAAVFSWHFIEKPAMTRRHALAAHITHSFSGLKAYWAGMGKGTA
ncbi:acyltransferase family protein [Pseudomonas sp. UBA1879]|uniref:acyltransferase family protein n=1 Tax=Pseudomonas sp. UBA1879 TaxID=1947305 RepID=UPI0025F0FBDA|nr:acyltransferase [Pseudomonas sp. UBA1879]